MSVSWERPEYRDNKAEWDKIDDVVFGRNLKKYLLPINPSDTSKENRERNDQYTKRAIFYGFAGYTFRGMVGAVYNKDPQLVLPSSMEYMLQNVDGAGNSVYQQSQSVLGDVVRKGRAGLFVCFPPSEGGVSRLNILNGTTVATIHHIECQDIINWRYRTEGSKRMLELVVFKFWDEQSMGFETDMVQKWRALSVEDGVYVDRIFSESSEGGSEGNGRVLLMESETIPRQSNGQPWPYIPFTFVGSENNDASIDPPPLLDLVRLNIGHYRNSADYEDSVYYAGQPQPWASGIDEAWINMAQGSGFYIGSRQLMPVPEGQTFAFASAPPNPLVLQAMREKVAQMIALGARIVQPGSASKTATQAESENAVAHSVLSLIAANVTEAYQHALEWAANYMGQPQEDILFELNRDFGITRADPQMLTAMVASWNQGALPTEQLWDWLRSVGLISGELTNEDLEAAQSGFVPLTEPVAQSQEAVPNE